MNITKPQVDLDLIKDEKLKATIKYIFEVMEEKYENVKKENPVLERNKWYLSNLKLQKLLYYCQVWSVTLQENKEAKIFKEDFQARVNWPVIQSVYDALKAEWSNDLHLKDLKQLSKVDTKQLSNDDKTIIDWVLTQYWEYTAWELVEMTHADEPRKKARNGLNAKQNCNNIINIDEKLIEFYKSKIING